MVLYHIFICFVYPQVQYVLVKMFMCKVLVLRLETENITILHDGT